MMGHKQYNVIINHHLLYNQGHRKIDTRMFSLDRSLSIKDRQSLSNKGDSYWDPLDHKFDKGSYIRIRVLK